MLEINYELKDMIISALRYAIGQRTYVTKATCDYIKAHPELIDERVQQIMLKDLEKTIDYYQMTDIDFAEFMKLGEWLKDLKV